MAVNFKQLGKRVKECRNNKNISQAELAERINVTSAYMSNIETATKKASLEVLVRISNELDTTVDKLLFGNQINDAAEYYKEFVELLSDCSLFEKRVLLELALAMKSSLRNNAWLN